MTVPPAQPSAQFMISELPEGLLPRIRSGFDILSKMSESDRRSVVRKFLDSFERITDLDGNWLNAVVSVERGDASTLLTALSVAVAILSQASNGLEEFLTAGRDKLFGESAMAAAREVATIIAQDRPRLTQTITLRTLSAETLPALEGFDVSVDFRFKFDKDNEIETGVPVAIVHIDTDARPELFLQMSRSDVEMMIEKLNIVLKQMSTATRAFEKFGSGK
jgi:hypothetical protein